MEIRALASSSAGNCYWVSDGRSPLLLDCGIRMDMIRRGVRFKVPEITACLVSHEHHDHSQSAHALVRAGVDCYMSEATRAALGLEGHHRVHTLRPLETVQIGTWTVLPFDAVHDAPCLGFVLASEAGKMLYLTDSAYCKYRFRGVTHMLVECNHSAALLRRNEAAGRITKAHKVRVLRNHMSVERLLDMLKANDLSRLREIHLLHLSDDNSDAAAFKAAVQRATGVPVYVAPSQGGGK